jgi:hypothetical protein
MRSTKKLFDEILKILPFGHSIFISLIPLQFEAAVQSLRQGQIEIEALSQFLTKIVLQWHK